MNGLEGSLSHLLGCADASCFQKEQMKTDGSPGNSEITSSTAQNSEAEQGKTFLSSAEKAAQLRKKLLESRKLIQKSDVDKNHTASISEEPEVSSAEKNSSEKHEETRSPGFFTKGSALDLEDLLAEGRAAAEAKAASRESSIVKNPLSGGRPFNDEHKLSSIGTPLASKEKADDQENIVKEQSKGSPSSASKKQESPEQGEILEDEGIEKKSKTEFGITPARNVNNVKKAETYVKAPFKENLNARVADTAYQNVRSRSPMSSRHKAYGTHRPMSPTGGNRELPKAVELTDFFSHYFDDVREWLELTGYHDQNYRKRAIQRYRALQVSEREVLKEQENGQHLMRTTTFSLPPPTYQSQSVAGVKRNLSPDRGRHSLSSAAKLPRTDYNRYHEFSTQHHASQRSSSVDASATPGNHDNASSSHQYRNRIRYFNREPSPLAQPPHHPDSHNIDNFETLDSRISARDQAAGRSYDFDRRHTDASIQFNRLDYGYSGPYHRGYEESDYSDHYDYHGRGRGRGRGRGYYNRGAYSDANGAGRGRGRGRGAPVSSEC